MVSQAAFYSKSFADTKGYELSDLSINGWTPGDWDEESIVEFQKKLNSVAKERFGNSLVKNDGWFGQKTLNAYVLLCGAKEGSEPATVKVQPGMLILNGEFVTPPTGLKVVNFMEEGGLVADEETLGDRGDNVVNQLVLHRGAERRGRHDSHAHATIAILNKRDLSTTFIIDADGTVYQTFDPAKNYGRHAAYHNRKSDSIDMAGPLGKSRVPVGGHDDPQQEKVTLKLAIGRVRDPKPPLKRRPVRYTCWDLTEAQKEALAVLVPFWCDLRSIPLRACGEYRSMRIGGAGRKDPVTNVDGILAHLQISGPGKRVDGAILLESLKEYETGIKWRKAKDFFDPTAGDDSYYDDGDEEPTDEMNDDEE